MKKQALLFACALIFGGVVAVGTGAPGTDTVTAARGGNPGPPPGKGGGGDVPDYGDLFIVYRDEYGVPIPSPVVTVTDPETGLDVDGGQCWQPLAAEASDDLDFLYDYDENGNLVVTDDQRGIPVDQYTCGVEAAFATLTQEVDFGRINEARSPEDVFLSQLEDAVTKLATADSTSLDPAGRMVASTCPDGTTSTIDSPLQNLAIYRQLMLTGTIGTPLPAVADPLDTAARGLGAASDKSGGVNVDMVAYLNAIMGLDEMTTVLDPKLCVTLRQEVQGEMQFVEKCFLNYGAYGYDRTANFEGLPSPPYIPAGEPEAGTFEYLVSLNTDPPTFGIIRGSILDAVFGTDVGFLDGNIGGFAQAADDTRAVIDFMHTHAVPPEEVTQVPCEASGDIKVDVSISDVSGLQVPRNVVDGSSDREFIVTVANAGPDDATVTLTVTATPEVSGIVLANLVGDDPDAGWIPSPFEFAVAEIAAGTSRSFSALISVDIGQRTTIDWTADASSVELDVNMGNNHVTAVSNVKVTGGGGGGGRP